MLQNISGFVGAVSLAAALVVALERAAPRLGLIDEPAGRKAHAAPTPVVGGLAIFIAFATVSVLLGLAPGRFAAFEIGLAGALLIGLVDDAVDLRPRTKFLALIAAAILMTTPGLVLASHLGVVGGVEISLGAFALPVTILMIVGLANAWNMLDGVDGAAGGAAAVALAALGAAALAAGRHDLVAMIVPLCAATLGFLAFNLRHPLRARARVFLGDAGSLMLGAGVAWLIAALATPDRTTGTTALPLVALWWIVCVPVFDTLGLMARRLAAGRSPMAADREHLHHLLMESGLSPARTAAIIIAACAACGAIGVGGLAIGVPDVIMGLGLAVPFALHAAFVTSVTRRRPVPVTAGRAAGARRLGQRSGLPGRPDIPAGPEL